MRFTSGAHRGILEVTFQQWVAFACIFLDWHTCGLPLSHQDGGSRVLSFLSRQHEYVLSRLPCMCFVGTGKHVCTSTSVSDGINLGFGACFLGYLQ